MVCLTPSVECVTLNLRVVRLTLALRYRGYLKIKYFFKRGSVLIKPTTWAEILIAANFTLVLLLWTNQRMSVPVGKPLFPCHGFP